MSPSALAWILGLTSILLLAESIAYWAWNGLLQPIHLAYVTAIVTAFVGALVASQHPRNTIGWLMLIFTLGTAISTVPYEYGWSALNNGWPLGPLALWIASWAWIPAFGIGFAIIAGRFPNGRLPHGWWFVDWLAIAGAVLFAVGIAFLPGPLYPSNRIDNPFGIPSLRVGLVIMYGLGVGLIAAAALTSAASLAARYRRTDREGQQQLKWIVLATSVVTVALLYGTAMKIAYHSDLTAALTPFAAALVLVPIGVGLAILRNHLFDVDLIINKTVVYAIVSAILGGLFVGVIELSQQLSVLYTGERSETAIVVTAFVVATAFTPVLKWAEHVVDRRLGGRDPAGKLDSLSASVEAVTTVIDPHQAARRLVDEAVAAFEAVGGAIYLDAYDHSQPFHASGHLSAGSALEVAVRHAEGNLGKFMLGRRRGSVPYSEHDRRSIQRSADALGEALAVAHQLGHVTHRKPASN